MFGESLHKPVWRAVAGAELTPIAERAFPALQASRDWARYRSAVDPLYGRWLAKNGLTRSAFGPQDLESNQTARATLANSVGEEKFVFIEPWVVQMLYPVRLLNLHKSEGLRILDLGSGGGHFSLLCEVLGHDVLGVDLRNETFDTICEALGVRRRIATVTPTYFDEKPERYDLILGLRVNFNIVGESVWEEEAWTHFVETAVRRLTPAGRLALLLNTQPNKTGPTVKNRRLPAHLLRLGFSLHAIDNSPFMVRRNAS
ncbi:MAG: hypothetical protein RIB45_01575 [Marivibrio sp.]|uniref:class I SAM-dependent methyltransferase n=1 Tax=Marivibrio sp. TaxID=2039719 RepID=UPI0032EE295F